MPLSKPAQFKDLIEPYDHCESELVIGLVCAVGTDYTPITECLIRILKTFGYESRLVKISSLIPKLSEDPRIIRTPEISRIDSLMSAGNDGCRDAGRNDLWALAAIAEINAIRERQKPESPPKALGRVAHIVLTLKRPEEVSTLRKVYGTGFFLIGVFASEKERLDHLLDLDAPKQTAKDLMRRDSEENDPNGQQTRATFHLSDVFVKQFDRQYETELDRFFNLVFADPFITPTKHEYAMFLAYASSLRSGSLARQVGAAIASRDGDILGLGCNDVPKPGGGLYWPGPGDRRDHVLGYDTNDLQRDKLTKLLVQRVSQSLDTQTTDELRRSFKKLLDITEYGRAVHAEMDAILNCARAGVSPAGSILYTTTFPCHNCTRHIIAAGIVRVIYIEPYAKSRAEELHEDAIVVEEKAMRENIERHPRKVPFTPFVGVGPRRYFDLFSLTQSSGFELLRKDQGSIVKVNRQGAIPRVPMSPLSYIHREAIAIKQLDSLPKQFEIFPSTNQER